MKNRFRSIFALAAAAACVFGISAHSVSAAAEYNVTEVARAQSAAGDVIDVTLDKAVAGDENVFVTGYNTDKKLMFVQPAAGENGVYSAEFGNTSTLDTSANISVMVWKVTDNGTPVVRPLAKQQLYATADLKIEKFDCKFVNRDKYLYRVGNMNTVALGSIFAAKDGAIVDKASVNIDIESLQPTGESVKSVYTANTSNWANGTVKFTGEGVVKATISDNTSAPVEVLLEVVDARNVTTYSELGSSDGKNKVMLNDITMSNGGRIYFNGISVYGNGFTFDVRNGIYTGQYTSSNALIILNNGYIDNINIVGAVYTEYGAEAKDNYNNCVVLSNGGSSRITNCCISNCAAPVRLLSGELYISNSTLKGGNYANFDLRSGSVTFEDVTTINQIGLNDKASDNSDVVGFGIVVYYENVENGSNITINGNLKQYNWISQNEVDSFKENHAKTIAGEIFKNTYSKYQYTNDGTKWVNTGIVSMINSFGSSNIIGTVQDYEGMSVSFSGRSGYVYTALAKAPETDVYSYANKAQGPNAPTEIFIYPHDENCSYDSSLKQLSVTFESGSSYSFDTSILTVTKGINNEISPVNVSMDNVDYTGRSIIFSQAGKYSVHYAYTDLYNYRLENGEITQYSLSYTRDLIVEVTELKTEIKDPEFMLGGNTATALQGTDGEYYLSIENGAHSKTKNGVTVKYPKVYISITEDKKNLTTNTSHSSNFYGLYPVFDEVITITDYNEDNTSKTYGASTTNMADGNLILVNDVTQAFKFESASSAPADNPITVNNKLYYVSPAISKDRKAKDLVECEYIYTAVNGKKYHYFVYYALKNNQTYSCFAPGTLITLADGTQKPIEQLDFDDRLLVWDFFEGDYAANCLSILVDHGEDTYDLANLIFSDGTVLRLEDHGLFDYDLNRFVYITADNCGGYIGHRFVQYNADGGYNIVTLDSAYKTTEKTRLYSITSEYTSNAFASGLLTAPPPGEFYNWIEMGGKLRYDADKFMADVEKYGTYDYEVFKDYVTYEQFIAFNGKYLKVPVEKGLFTFDDILELINEYKEFMPE